jgi:electron transport complex protein RnfD
VAPDNGAPAVRRIMVIVLLALAPGIAVQVYAFGPDLLSNLVGAVLGAVATEFVLLCSDRRAALRAIGDGSALVTGALIAIAVPPAVPVTVVVLASVFAVAVGKHAYGGIGRNPFNPAMVGYALVLVSFPGLMAVWPSAADGIVDVISAATPLDVARHQPLMKSQGLESLVMTNPGWSNSWPDLWSDLWSDKRPSLGQDPWPTIALAYGAGGLWMVYRRAADVVLVAGTLAGVALSAGVVGVFATDGEGMVFHLLHGAVVVGAFFVVTDPVTAPAGRMARCVYAFLIGSLTVVIREFGGYPDGFAFAVLLCNAAAPVLERALSTPSSTPSP